MMRLEGVDFAYPGGSEGIFPATPAVREIHLEIAEREFAAVIGPNGAGKSTLLKLMDGLIFPTKGTITLQKRALSAYPRRELARLIGYVGQSFRTTFDFTAEEIVQMGRYPFLSPLEREKPEDRQRIRQAMEATEVWQFRYRRMSELSGGEQQRVVLASALAQEASLLLLDEPTAALDLKHQVQFYEILHQLRQERNLTILIATHDVNLAVRYCRRLVVLKGGQIVADGPPEAILRRPLMESVYEVPVEIIPHPRDGKPLILLA
ncbi:MAG: ABC transporter ATP-binding protein [Calditrichaeota bacterium]|nr:MAG: ABC transporter ATP-binding protein [Calditrichota bacterium]